jgi:peptidyl-tRNA hydrolase
LKTDNFPRLRIGIGEPGKEVGQYPVHQGGMRTSDTYADYVLGSFSKNEKAMLNVVIDRAIMGIEMLVAHGFEKAQNYINSIDVGKEYQDNS